MLYRIFDAENAFAAGAPLFGSTMGPAGAAFSTALRNGGQKTWCSLPNNGTPCSQPSVLIFSHLNLSPPHAPRPTPIPGYAAS